VDTRSGLPLGVKRMVGRTLGLHVNRRWIVAERLPVDSLSTEAERVELIALRAEPKRAREWRTARRSGLRLWWLRRRIETQRLLLILGRQAVSISRQRWGRLLLGVLVACFGAIDAASVYEFICLVRTPSSPHFVLRWSTTPLVLGSSTRATWSLAVRLLGGAEPDGEAGDSACVKRPAARRGASPPRSKSRR
jgi:hypothetical protein